MGKLQGTLVGLGLFLSYLGAAQIVSKNSISINYLLGKERLLPDKYFTLVSDSDDISKTLTLSFSPLEIDIPLRNRFYFYGVDINNDGLNLSVYFPNNGPYAICSRGGYRKSSNFIETYDKQIFNYLVLAVDKIPRISSRIELEELVKSEKIFTDPKGVDVYFPADGKDKRKAYGKYIHGKNPRIVIRFERLSILNKFLLPDLVFLYNQVLDNGREVAIKYQEMDIDFPLAKIELRPISSFVTKQ